MKAVFVKRMHFFYGSLREGKLIIFSIVLLECLGIPVFQVAAQ